MQPNPSLLTSSPLALLPIPPIRQGLMSSGGISVAPLKLSSLRLFEKHAARLNPALISTCPSSSRRMLLSMSECLWTRSGKILLTQLSLSLYAKLNNLSRYLNSITLNFKIQDKNPCNKVNSIPKAL